MQQVLEGYAAAAPELINRFSAVSSSDLFKPVIDLLPLSRRVSSTSERVRAGMRRGWPTWATPS